MKKSSGLTDFIFGTKDVRVLKKLSKEIISKLKRDRSIDDVDLSIDSEGLIEGSFVIYDIRYDVFSVVEQGSAILFLDFRTNDFPKPFKFGDQILIQEPNPLGRFYIGVDKTYEPNLEAVPRLVKRIVNRCLDRHREELKQEERERSDQARMDNEERKRVRRKEYFSRVKKASRESSFFGMLIDIAKELDNLPDVYVTSSDLEDEFTAFLESMNLEPRHTHFSDVHMKVNRGRSSITVSSTPLDFKISVKPDGCVVIKNV